MKSIKLIIILLVLVSVIASCSVQCGDGVCHPREDRRESCPADCEPVTINPGDTPVEPPIDPVDDIVIDPKDDYGPGDHTITLVHDGMTRTYFVHTPPNYNINNNYAAILAFHGGGGDAANQMKQSQMSSHADKNGYIVVYPQGTGRNIGQKNIFTWNAGRCCGVAEIEQTDDVGFVSALIDDLSTKFSVDKNRVYATGHSNGAMLSYRLACELAHKIAAIAPNAGHDAFDNCNPSRPVSIMHFHGKEDKSAKYEGGQCGGRLGDDGWVCDPVEDFIDEWADINGCSGEGKTVYQQGDASCTSFAPCDQGTDVVLCTIEGTGHTWPGGEYAIDAKFWENNVGPISRDISANDQMWNFFQKHSLN